MAPPRVIADWAPPNIFNYLQLVECHMESITWPQTNKVRSFAVHATIPVGEPLPAPTFVKRMRIQHQQLQWHPDNMTLPQIVAVLSTIDDSTLLTPQDAGKL
ncbi:hypothetical protein As57867_005243, partial [Aphanomyces stellatus]